MSKEIIQYGLVAGEISPKLFGRPDLEKYDFAVAHADNWLIDFRGGAFTRPGTEHVDFVKSPTSATKLVRFQYAPDTEDSYLIVFGNGYIRFIQSGAYVLEADKTITGVTAVNPGVVTSVAHSFANGDWIQITGVVGMTQLNGRTFEVSNITANTFRLTNPITNTEVDTSAYTAYSSGGIANRIYTITNPYAVADLDKLKVYQIRDYMRMTHPDYAIRNLVRTAATSWAISLEAIGNAIAAPTGLAGAGSGAGTAGCGFVVTSVDTDGNESVASAMYHLDNVVNYAATAGFAKITWTAVTGAVEYRVYRTIILSDGAYLHVGMQVGYLGRTIAPSFLDNNITPDFTGSPPIHYNPFDDGAIAAITITNVGSGYTSEPAVSVAGGGSGFIGQAIRDGITNTIIGVKILNAGSGYTNPTVSFTGGGGANAAATATATAVTGNYPATSTLFQQRQVYAATENKPLTVFGSKTGLLSNFDSSQLLTDSDAFEFDVNTPTVAPIRHLSDMRGGLLVMSQSGVWQLAGGSVVALTPTNALAEPQTYIGPSDLVPLYVDTDLLYVTQKESLVKLLSYTDYTKLYSGQDMSVLANHFFSAMNRVVRWAYAESPNRIIWCVREDGSLLAFALVREQNVFAWTQNHTEGFFRDAAVVEEDGEDRVYFTVERRIGANTVKTIERLARRNFVNVEDAIFLDDTLTLGGTYPGATLTLSAYAVEAAVTLTASAGVFASGDVNKIVRAGGGKIRITGYTSTTVVTGIILQEVTDRIPISEEIVVQASGEWTLDAEITTISGLWHLEGKTVGVLANGSVLANKTVVNGSITLESAASRVVVGLRYTARLQTLPPTAPEAIVEGRRKSLVGVSMRVNETRGLSLGADLDHLYDMKDRTTELWGEPTNLQTKMSYEFLAGNWDENGQMWFVQANPLPATILSFVKDLEIGDDTD